MRRRATRALLAALVTAGSGAAGAAGETAGGPPPHVVLISIDTLRADRLGVYGHRRPTSPRLDALARSAVRFEQAYAPAPWTLPSHATMLTGVHAWDLGIDGQWSRLPEEVPTLAELLAARGYRTAAFVDSSPSGFVGAERGFDRGFERYDHGPHRPEQPLRFLAETTVDAAVEWLDGLPGDARFFLFLHTKSVHALAGSDPCLDPRCFPYDKPAPFRFRFVPSRRAPFAWSDAELGRGQLYLWSLNRRVQSGELDPSTYPRRRLSVLRAKYDEGIAYTDHHVGRLLDALDARHLLDRSLVVVTSDHGEAFLDHALFLHQEVYEESIRVPLLVRPPGGLAAPRVRRRPVSLEDVVPTVLTRVGVAAPAAVTGRPLPLAAAVPAPVPRDLFHYYRLPERFAYRAFALRRDGSKLVAHNPGGGERLRFAGYDLAADPGETDPLPAARGPFAALRAELMRRLRRAPAADGGELPHPPEEDLEGLAALGYVE